MRNTRESNKRKQHLKIDLKPFASKLKREDCKSFYRDDSNKGMSWFEGIPNG